MRALLIAALLALASPTLAFGEDLAKARAFFDAGKRAYEKGQYKQAIAAFNESYALSPRSATTFSLAQANRLQYFQDRDPAKLKRALDLYRQYLSDEPTGTRRGDSTEHISSLEPIWLRMEDKDRRVADTAPDNATQIMVSSQVPGAMGKVDDQPPIELPLVLSIAPGKHVVSVEAPGHFPETYEQIAIQGRLVMVDAKLEPRPGTVKVEAPDGAEISLSGRPIGEAPLAPLSVPAGKYLLTISQTGRYPAQRELAIERGGEATVEIELETTRQRYIAYGMWGLSATVIALGGMTTAFALSQESQAQDIADRRARQALLPDEVSSYDRAIRRRDELSNVAFVLFGSASAMAITGTFLYFFDKPRIDAMPSSIEVIPTASDDGGGVQVRGRM